MLYRITGPVYLRGSYPAAAAAAVALVVYIILSGSHGASVTSLVLYSLLAAWAAAIGVRGWRSATLLARTDKITVRQLVWTTSWAWQQIDGFTVQTQPVLWLWLLPLVRRSRRVLGVRLRDPRNMYWLSELNARPSADGSSWVDTAAARLNELLQQQQAPRTSV